MKKPEVLRIVEEHPADLSESLHRYTSDVIHCAERGICPVCRVALVENGSLWECPAEECGFYRIERRKE